MKKSTSLILLFCFCLISILPAHAQVSGSTYYGDDAMKYKGATLKVISSQLPYKYFLLHKELPFNEPDNFYLPDAKGLASDPYKIFGQEFIVDDVTRHPTEPDTYFLEMREVKTGQLVYYYYGSFGKTFWAMKVVTAEDSLDDQSREETRAAQEEEARRPVDYCSEIEVVKDKFTGKVYYHSPYRAHYNVMLYKDVYKSQPPKYTLRLFTTDYVINVNRAGVTLLLDNGAKISRPQTEVEVEVREYDTHGLGDYEYSAWVTLNAAERALLMKHSITDFRLYISDQEIDEKEGSLIREYLKCLSGKK